MCFDLYLFGLKLQYCISTTKLTLMLVYPLYSHHVKRLKSVYLVCLKGRKSVFENAFLFS